MKTNSLSLGIVLIVMGILTVPLCDGDITVLLFLLPVAIAQTWHAIKVRRRAARIAARRAKSANKPIQLTTTIRKVAAL